VEAKELEFVVVDITFKNDNFPSDGFLPTLRPLTISNHQIIQIVSSSTLQVSRWQIGEVKRKRRRTTWTTWRRVHPRRILACCKVVG
jgi:hypothetical protein